MSARLYTETLLWNIYLDNLLGLLDREKSIIDFAAYTDDLCILIGGNSRKELEIKAYMVIRTIHNWCQRYKMTMSLTKTQVMWKNTKKKVNNKAGNNHPPSKRRHKISKHGSWIRNSISPNM